MKFESDGEEPAALLMIQLKVMALPVGELRKVCRGKQLKALGSLTQRVSTFSRKLLKAKEPWGKGPSSPSAEGDAEGSQPRLMVVQSHYAASSESVVDYSNHYATSARDVPLPSVPQSDDETDDEADYDDGNDDGDGG